MVDLLEYTLVEYLALLLALKQTTSSLISCVPSLYRVRDEGHHSRDVLVNGGPHVIQDLVVFFLEVGFLLVLHLDTRFADLEEVLLQLSKVFDVSLEDPLVGDH